jgi:hypothetical protein
MKERRGISAIMIVIAAIAFVIVPATVQSAAALGVSAATTVSASGAGGTPWI